MNAIVLPCAPALLALLASSALAAAPQTVIPRPGAQGQVQSPQQQQPQQPQGLPPSDPDNLRSRWSPGPQQPPFAGFPVFPGSLPGYGAYPRQPGQQNAHPLSVLPIGGSRPLPPVYDVPAERGPFMAPAPPEPGYPGWSQLRADGELPYAADRALLIRHGERVWWRADPDEPFVPVEFHDKLHPLAAGAAVEVRQQGIFELTLHDSTALWSRGPAKVQVGALNATEVNLQIDLLTSLRVRSTGRAHRITLPDGSLLRWEAPTPDQLGYEVVVHFDRDDEPRWYGGRATLLNYGERDVIWQHAFGEVVLKPDHRVQLLLSRPPHTIGAPLIAPGAQVQRDGAIATVRAEQATDVRCCGAQIALPPGGTLRLDPLLGDPFAPAVTAPPVTQAPSQPR